MPTIPNNKPAASEARRRRFRKLRIAWSVGCLVACVLLIMLWVRSYRTHDVVYCHVPFTDIFGGDSRFGSIHIGMGKVKTPLRFAVHSEYLTAEQMVQLYSNPADPMNARPNRFGIGFTYHPSGYTILTLQDWLIALFAALCGSLPWLRWRFRLRTLLIATTLVAVGLGLIVYFSSKAPKAPSLDQGGWPSGPSTSR
jgi:hypothetical protein